MKKKFSKHPRGGAIDCNSIWEELAVSQSPPRAPTQSVTDFSKNS